MSTSLGGDIKKSDTRDFPNSVGTVLPVERTGSSYQFPAIENEILFCDISFSSTVRGKNEQIRTT
jgi:hypothetical protein